MFPTINFGIEHWKWSDEYNVYVSTEGRFRDKEGHLISPKITKDGYLILNLQLCHRIVMKTWRPLSESKMKRYTVDHLNHNKRDNSLKNLEWVTAAENHRRAIEDLEKREIEIKEDTVYLVNGVKFSKEQMIVAFMDNNNANNYDVEKWFNKCIKEKLEIKSKRRLFGKMMEVVEDYV